MPRWSIANKEVYRLRAETCQFDPVVNAHITTKLVPVFLKALFIS